MNMQILIPLDDLTKENGATSIRPGSQTVVEYPSNVEEYRSKSQKYLTKYYLPLLILQQIVKIENEDRILAKAGDAVMFVGTLQHCAMPNHSQASRSVILLQYLPKWVRPMEDQKRMLKEEVNGFYHTFFYRICHIYFVFFLSFTIRFV